MLKSDKPCDDKTTYVPIPNKSYYLPSSLVKEIKREVFEEESVYLSRPVREADLVNILTEAKEKSNIECHEKDDSRKEDLVTISRERLGRRAKDDKGYFEPETSERSFINAVMKSVFVHRTNLGVVRSFQFIEKTKGLPCLVRKFKKGDTDSPSNVLIVVDRYGNKKKPTYVSKDRNGIRISKYAIDVGDTLVEGYLYGNKSLIIATWRVASLNRKNNVCACVGTGMYDGIRWTFSHMYEKFESSVLELYYHIVCHGKS